MDSTSAVSTSSYENYSSIIFQAGFLYQAFAFAFFCPLFDVIYFIPDFSEVLNVIVTLS